ncbi:MAG: hypothetical protein ACTHMU_09695 [Thermomicrobiales bacterium]
MAGAVRGAGAMNRINRDLTGETFGRWTVLRRAKNVGKDWYFHCRCQCGTARDVLARSLVYGMSQSCGCLSRDTTSQRSRIMHTAWREWRTSAEFPVEFALSPGHYLSIAQQRNWQREIARVRRFEARRESEWLAQRGQRQESAA